MANFALDRLFARMGAARDTNVLNDLIIGAAAAVLAYVWVSRQDVKHALELSREKLMQEAIHSNASASLSSFTIPCVRRTQDRSCI